MFTAPCVGTIDLQTEGFTVKYSSFNYYIVSLASYYTACLPDSYNHPQNQALIS